MPLSIYAIDNFVAQDLSKLTECRPPSIAPEFPDYTSWVGSFVLNWIHRIQLPKNKAALAFVLIRRAESALGDYEEARAYLASFVGGDHRNISLYFRCLGRFESTVAMVYQSLDFVRRTLGRKKVFTKGQGSPYERVNCIYNASKHSDPETLPAGRLHAVWIKNDGLYADRVHLTFEELGDLVRQIGRIAEKFAKGEVPVLPSDAPDLPRDMPSARP